MDATTLVEKFQHRVLDDSSYCERRLGFIPTGAAVAAASKATIDRVLAEFPEWLDPFEAEVWDALEEAEILPQDRADWTPTYSPWRHGGWYVDNLRYPSGAVGCVSRNYADRKWRIACDPRPFEEQPTFPNRDAAARGERDLIAELREKSVA